MTYTITQLYVIMVIVQEVYINIDVDYSGGLQIAVDADLVRDHY